MGSESQNFVVMGAGHVGYYLAETLSTKGNDVVLVEQDAAFGAEIREQLDVNVVVGNGAHIPVLQAANVAGCDLFMAVTSDDETNLASALLAKHLGAERTVARVGVAEEVTQYHRTYEQLFGIDLLMSTQLLSTNRILNHVLGHNTVAVEYLVQDRIQLRRIRLDKDSPLVQTPLRDLKLPSDSLVVAYFSGEELTIPSGDSKAKIGDDALILALSECIDAVESFVSGRVEKPETAVIAGGGVTGSTVATSLRGKVRRLKIIERNRARAEELATIFPECQVLHGDATDEALLRAEGVGEAHAFIAATGHDEINLMASLLAKDLGVPEVVAVVERSQTTRVWRRLGLVHVVSPRAMVYERIEGYIQSGYNANIVSLQRGSAQVIERRIYAGSPTAGVSLRDMDLPRGLIVGAVIRGERVFVPRGDAQLEIGDRVILFVKEEEVSLLRLFFPDREAEE